MKRFGIILGILLLCIVTFILISTTSVKRSSFYNEEYYRSTAALIESARSAVIITDDSLQSGFARISITPTLNCAEDNYMEGKFINVPLAGYGARKGKPATGIHDSIFVKAVALKVNKQTIVLVGADLLIMPPNIIDSVAIVLSNAGIKRDQLFFSATHCHSSLGGWGPGYIGKLFAGNENKNLEKWLVMQISRAVTEAISDLKPSRIGTGSFKAEDYTNNRAIGKSGTKNNDFSFITLEQRGGRKAVIGSFSAHATTMSGKNMLISADYPGYWERKIEDKTADVALFFAGATGSQSPAGEGEGFDRPKNIGESLADSLVQHLSRVPLNDKITFSALSVKIKLPEYHIRLTTTINLSTFWSNKLMPEPANVYLQSVRLGNTVWITTPCDFSGEYALQLKNSMAAEGYKLNVSSFNGSYIGYVVPPRYFYLDEYESQTMGWFGPDMGDYTMEIIRQILRVVAKNDNI